MNRKGLEVFTSFMILIRINFTKIMLILDLFKLYIDDKRVYCAEKTVVYYQNMLHVFNIYLCNNSVTITEQINSDILKNFVVYLRSKVKNTSIHTYMRAVKNLCSWGILGGYIPPFDYRLKLPRPDPDKVLPLSTQEVNDILKYINDKCYNSCNKELYFRLLLDCGLRSSEALALSIDDFDFKNNIIIIKQSKFEKSRIIPLPEVIKELLSGYSGKLFDFDISGKNSFFARIKSGSGVNRVHAHLLRHTFATSYIMSKGNIEYLRMYLGHSSYDVTQVYIKSAYECNLIHYDIYRISDIFS